MVDHGAADAECIAEMHAWHCGERVDEVTGHEDGGCIVVTDGVEKAVFSWEQSGWHARVEGKCQEGEEVGEG